MIVFPPKIPQIVECHHLSGTRVAEFITNTQRREKISAGSSSPLEDTYTSEIALWWSWALNPLVYEMRASMDWSRTPHTPWRRSSPLRLPISSLDPTMGF